MTVINNLVKTHFLRIESVLCPIFSDDQREMTNQVSPFFIYSQSNFLFLLAHSRHEKHALIVHRNKVVSLTEVSRVFYVTYYQKALYHFLKSRIKIQIFIFLFLLCNSAMTYKKRL